MDPKTRYDIIAREPIEEIITPDELFELLNAKQAPVAYDGFEPSGLAHLGTGVLRAIRFRICLRRDAGLSFFWRIGMRC